MDDLIKRLRGLHFVAGGICDEAADALEAANARLAEFERILDGLPQDAIDGGWTAKGISAYAKKLEDDLAFQKSVTDAARQQQADLLECAENAEARAALASSEAQAVEAVANIRIDTYAIPISRTDAILIQRAQQTSGADLWKVKHGGDCLSKSGEWECEPMPSSRDDAFLARCRFATAEEAIDAAIEHTAKEKGNG